MSLLIAVPDHIAGTVEQLWRPQYGTIEEGICLRSSAICPYRAGTVEQLSRPQHGTSRREYVSTHRPT